MKKKFISIILVTLMTFSLSVSAYAADAGDEVIGYDFSAVDDLNAYDQYEKTVSTGEEKDILPSGSEYVLAYKSNSIDTIQPLPINFYRYGAFLREPGEQQNYMLLNTPNNVAITKSALTIYADPGVSFTVTHLNRVIADQAGIKVAQEVEYYRKSTDNGHNVYYIELSQDSIDACRHMLTFTTNLSAVQPHYSFWFGNPVPEEHTVTSNTISLSIRNPNAASAALNIIPTGAIPTERAWVNTVTVRPISISGAANVSGVSLRVTMPEDKNPAVGALISAHPTGMEFLDYPSIASASPARGTYKFQLTSARWSSSAPASATYKFTGQVSITYIAAFGA